ncbi:MAG TPA: DUF177 domain-containing protein [Saprospiraceae bacterium]|nr:DUF177 domain-containing protein [Saprospiraceae bacterium]HNL37777.1 DUF177 domain-containing protein [Saprospiraceae bacterium]HNM26125.1 DUF177 domain-containing protein [Saprospiraceae bacterium]
MDPLLAYSIPIQGLKIGIHRFHYELDRAFFRHFEASLVSEGLITFDLTLDKRPDMLVLDFELTGHVQAECDRCTAPIQLPIDDSRQLLVKYGEAEGEEEDEVVFIPRETSDFNVGQYLYEFTVLALPITNTYDCQSEANPPCNTDVLQRLNQEADDNQQGDSVWDALKDLNNK